MFVLLNRQMSSSDHQTGFPSGLPALFSSPPGWLLAAPQTHLNAEPGDFRVTSHTAVPTASDSSESSDAGALVAPFSQATGVA